MASTSTQHATGTTSTDRRPDPRVSTEDFIRRQIQRTRSTVKAVDIATSLLLLATVTLGFLFAAAVVEHWLVPGGFGFSVRSLLLAALVAFAGYYSWRHLWPYAVQSVNPAYAADAIERHNPSLKNSLLNFLLLGRRREEVPEAIYQTLEQQAAQRLARVPLETAVDRTPLIHVAMCFATVIIVATVYKIASPKDPITTARRVLLPWAEIAAPSRVAIDGIQPGTATATVGDVVKISALIRGLANDDEVLVRYTTEDGRAVDQPITMWSTSGEIQFECELPDPNSAVASAGVQRNVKYRVEAGDARSREFLLTVVAAPTITTASVHYDYPEYTGYINKTIEGMGDIRAIEGTHVTIHARSNGPISDAYVDFEADGQRDLNMDHTKGRASASFPLALRADRQTPEHTGYALRVTNDKGQTNRQPAQYTIDVVPDYVPELDILQPEESVRDVRLNEVVTIEIEARDPDFALAKVRIVGEVSGKKVVDEVLLDQPHIGRFTHSLRFRPSQYGLRSGDVLNYWAAAHDNRTPQANETASRRRQLRIVSPSPAEPPAENQIAKNDPRNRQPQKQDSQRGDDGRSDSSEQGAGKQQQQGEKEQGARSDSAESDNENRGPEDGAQAAGEQTPRQDSSSSTGENQSPDHNATTDTGDESTDPKAGQQSGQRSGNAGDSAEGHSSVGEDPSPVSPDGDNDSEAFQRIARHLNDDERNEQQQNRDSESRDEQERESAEQSNERQSREPAAGDRSAEQSTSDAPHSDRRNGSERDGNAADDQPVGEEESRPGQSAADGNQPNEREGDADSTVGQRPRTEGANRSENQSQPDESSPAPGDDPQAQPENWKQNPSGDTDQSDDGEPPSPGQGKRKPDSPGEKGADDPGDGGFDGSGKNAQRDGTGSAGQNQSADEGSGQSSERGTGRTSSGAGDKHPSESSTGQSDDEAGDGSDHREGEGNKSGGQAPKDAGQSGKDQRAEDRGQNADDGGPGADERSTERGDQSSQAGSDESRGQQTHSSENLPGDTPGEQSSSSEPRGSTPSGAGGRTGTDARQPSPGGEGSPGGDAANLEYAREKTELVLDKLSDMLKKQDVDQELLDKLGWNEEDLRRFVKRWQSLQQAAESSNEESAPANQVWKDALRSVGWRNVDGRTDRTKDAIRDLRQGVRVSVPPEYQDRLREYNQGVSRVREGLSE